MNAFMDKDFLLDTAKGRELFHDYADGLPIFDYHCHLSPKEIAENQPFSDIAEIWLKGDHYKWRNMRSNGAEEALCSGNAGWAQKFQAYAASLELAAGNPLLHWSHLELQRAYGIHEPLTEHNALALRDRANAIIKERGDTPRSMFKKFGVAVVCTTDDPADDLHWHDQIAADPAAQGTRVTPAFRPDKAMNAQDPMAWKAYTAQLGKAADVEICTFADLAEALSKRHAAFHARGCRLSDHALLVPPFALAGSGELDQIVSLLLEGKAIDGPAREKLATAVLLHVARLDSAAGWTMQLHMGALRNVNSRLFRLYGPDGGGDAISDASLISPLAAFLDTLDAESALPKTILYSLDDTKNASLAVLAQCYAGSYAPGEKGLPGKLQYGSAWWFNDHLDGMERHLTQVASVGLIGRWVGMLTDSRSFLSYPRHEYFRRILCRNVGRWVEAGELPGDEAYAVNLVRNISWHNAKNYFGIDVPAWAAKAR